VKDGAALRVCELKHWRDWLLNVFKVMFADQFQFLGPFAAGGQNRDSATGEQLVDPESRVDSVPFEASPCLLQKDRDATPVPCCRLVTVKTDSNTVSENAV
jgi:hypothetical protein